MNAIHPVLIANKHGYKYVPVQDKHRDFFRGQCVRHKCYSLMLALIDSFEIDIQPSSHMDSGRGYIWVKIERRLLKAVVTPSHIVIDSIV